MSVIQQQRGTAAALTASNPVIAAGQIVYETDTNKIKVGDGTTAWTNLNYISPPEVLEYATSASFPATGSTSKIYVATDASRTYRWTGSQYVEVGPVGTYLPSHVHDASDITTGVIAPARLGSGATSSLFLRGDSLFADPMSYATLLQSQNGAASPAVTPANVYQQMAKWKLFDLVGFQSTVVGSGSTFSNIIMQISSGSTANSSLVLRPSNEYYTMIAYGNSQAGWQGGTYWSRPQMIAFRVAPNLASANAVWRFQFGKSQATTTVGRMANAGMGVELQYVNSTTNRIWMLAHNGTTLNAVDTALNVRQQSVYDFVLTSDAGGNITMLVNDGSVASYTITGGPTSGGIVGLTTEILNGTDAVNSTVHMYRFPFFTSLS